MTDTKPKINTDKVLALAREAGLAVTISSHDSLYKFAALLQREMEAENAALNKEPIDPNKWAFDRGLESY